MKQRFQLSALSIVLLAIGPEVLAGQEEFDRAKEKAQEAYAVFATFTSVSTETGEAASQEYFDRALELLAESKEIFEQGGVRKSKDSAALNEYANVLLGMGNPDLAAKALENALAADPDNVEVWLNLGHVRAMLGDARRLSAKEAYDRCLALKPPAETAAQAQEGLGDLFRQMGLYELAEESLVEALALDPARPRLRMLLAVLMVRSGRMMEADAAIEYLTIEAPQQIPELQRLLVDAVADFERARLWFPDKAGEHLAYAKVLLHSGRTEESVGPLERSVTLNANNYVAWNLLGSISQRLNRVKRAREAFERSLDLKPDQPRTVDALASLENPAEQ